MNIALGYLKTFLGVLLGDEAYPIKEKSYNSKELCLFFTYLPISGNILWV